MNIEFIVHRRNITTKVIRTAVTSKVRIKRIVDCIWKYLNQLSTERVERASSSEMLLPCIRTIRFTFFSDIRNCYSTITLGLLIILVLRANKWRYSNVAS